ncbi:uncharacterized protein LOC131325334 [Rhododendron vialii]|uniref:uncharacterized protein LOC131325334 n=1 Tax=Rhododendron vialii TaxID=182163 RepID=UPI00265DD2D1|nr:uncharacterized protein LOC131325334 [Rhododendron vialii]
MADSSQPDMSITEKKRLTCFFYYGGERRVLPNGTFQYVGGVSEAMLIEDDMARGELLSRIVSRLSISLHNKLIFHNTKMDKTKYLRVRDTNGVKMMFYLNEDEVDVFVEEQYPFDTSTRESNIVESNKTPREMLRKATKKKKNHSTKQKQEEEPEDEPSDNPEEDAPSSRPEMKPQDMSITGKKRLTCFLYCGGERRVLPNGTFHYVGGISEAMLIEDNASNKVLLLKISSCLNVSLHNKSIFYNTKSDKTKYLRVKDNNGVKMMFYLNEDEVDVFVDEDPFDTSTRESNIVESNKAPRDMSITENKRLTCFYYYGGERRVLLNDTFDYVGGVCGAMLIEDNVSNEELLSKISSCLNISLHNMLIFHNMKRDKTKYLCVRDDNGVKMLFYLNEDEVDVFVDKDPIHASTRESNIVESNETPRAAGNIERREEKKYKWWRYIPLVKATLRGDWKTAENFFQRDKSALTGPIKETGDTALHIAVGVGKENIHFVEKLVELMPVEALALKNMDGNTPLHLAASIGNTKAAAMLVGKHLPLLYIGTSVVFYGDYMLPIHCAALYGRRDTLLCLSDVTSDDQVAVNEHSCAIFVHWLISSEFFDIALKWVEKYPRLAIRKFEFLPSALEAMAGKCSAFPSGSQLNFWQRKIYPYVPVKLDKCSVKDQNKRDDVEMSIPQVMSSHAHEDNRAQSFGKNISIFGHPVSQNLQATLWKVLEFSAVPQTKHIRKEKLRHVQALQLVKTLCEKITHYDGVGYDNVAGNAMVTAIQNGVPEIIEEIADRFPSLIWIKIDEDQNLFHQAVKNRDEKVFNLVYQMSDQRYIATNIIGNWTGNTILHLAGRLAPQKKLSLVAGPALQMQRELQWFEEVKKFVHPGLIEFRNGEGETPEMVFTKEHMHLVAEGGHWMKETASSCTVPAALIVTIVFAAAITVPGGNSGNTGLPVFYQKVAFIIFAVSDAFSLFMSATSLLMFLSILNFPYEERDFLYVLPKRLIIGLFTLFLSITAMVVAFSCTLYLMFGQNKAWILIPVAALACLPITSFVTLQFPLLVTLISSTYGSGVFGKQSDRMLH